MIYCIYETKCKENGKVYVGFHTIKSVDLILTEYNDKGSCFQDGYLGSGIVLKRAVKAYGKESFSQRILSKHTVLEDAMKAEKEIVNEEFIKRDDVYNLTLGGAVSWKHIGTNQTEEHRRKIGEASKRWIAENPEAHKERMDKINKNPEKIRKTAEKHRGMKRSKETCKNISESLKGLETHNKGLIAIYNTETKELKYVEPDHVLEDNWIRGTKNPKEHQHRGFVIHNPLTLEISMIKNIDDLPEGWEYGRKPSDKKKTKEDVLRDYEKYLRKVERRKNKNGGKP